MEFHGAFFNVDEDKEIAFGVVVAFYGDKDYAFLDEEKEAMKVVIAEAVMDNLLPNQLAEVFTMSIT